MNSPTGPSTEEAEVPMLGLTLLTGFATAAPLQLGQDVRFADDVALDRGATAWTLDDDSFVFPVRSDEALVGWIGIGPGEQTFAFEAKWQAERFANTWVAGEEVAAEAVASAVTTGSWTEPFDAVMALSVDEAVWSVVSDLKHVVSDRSAVGYLDDEGVFNVVVSPLSLDRARRLAKRALTDRVQELAHGGLDIHDALAIDTADPGPDRWLVDVRTERSWRVFVEPAVDNLQGRWLSTVHDPYGWVDDALQTQVFVVGRGRDEAPKRATIAGTPWSAEGRTSGAIVTAHQANVLVAEEHGGRSMSVAVDQRLTLTARGPTSTIAFSQPFFVEQSFYEGPPMAQAYETLTVETADGQSLTRVATVFGTLPEEGVDAGVWQLPAPLQAGESVTLQLHHIDRWRSSSLLEVTPWILAELECRPATNLCGHPSCMPFCDKVDEFIELGRVSAAQPVVTRQVGQPAHPVELRVGTALPGSWNVALTGGRTERRDAGDGRWWVAQTDSRARVTLARDRGSSAYPAMGLPGIEILGHGPDQPGIAPFLRSVFHFYAETFPGLSLSELDLIQAADKPAVSNPRRPAHFPLPEVEAHPGQVVVHGMRELLASSTGESMGGGSLEARMNRHAPHHVEREIAGAVGAQWFLEHGTAQRDAWLAEAAAGYLRSRFTAEAYGPDEAATWDSRQRKAMAADIVGAPAVPLDRPQRWTATVGAGWLSALEARIGERAVNRALVAVLESEHRTTDDLAAALGSKGSTDASHWVDFWVRGGVRPTVRATWSQTDAGQLTVDVSADTPFGQFALPLAVDDRKGTRVVWVEVVHGVGTTTVDLRRQVEAVRVDPDGLLPLKKGTATPSDPAAPKAQGAPRVL